MVSTNMHRLATRVNLVIYANGLLGSPSLAAHPPLQDV